MLCREDVPPCFHFHPISMICRTTGACTCTCIRITDDKVEMQMQVQEDWACPYGKMKTEYLVVSPGSRPRSQSSPWCSQQKTPTFQGHLRPGRLPGCTEFRFGMPWVITTVQICYYLAFCGVTHHHLPRTLINPLPNSPHQGVCNLTYKLVIHKPFWHNRNWDFGSAGSGKRRRLRSELFQVCHVRWALPTPQTCQPIESA
jgi:hypothetical protein